MAVSFDSLISNPLESSATANFRYSKLDTFLVYSVNLTMYLLYGVLIVMLVYNLFQMIHKITNSAEEEGVAKFREGITNAVACAVALVFILSVRLIFRMLFTFLGIPLSENPYYILPFGGIRDD